MRVVKVRLTTDQGTFVFARLTFVVTEVRTPILALATLCDNGAAFNLKNGTAMIEKDGHVIPIRRRGNLYFVPFVFAVTRMNPTMIGQVNGGGATGSSSVAVTETSPPVVAQTLPQPQLPSKEEIAAHALTHLPYAGWCESCIRGRGREDAHRRKAKTEESPGLLLLEPWHGDGEGRTRDGDGVGHHR